MNPTVFQLARYHQTSLLGEIIWFGVGGVVAAAMCTMDYLRAHPPVVHRLLRYQFFFLVIVPSPKAGTVVNRSAPTDQRGWFAISTRLNLPLLPRSPG